MSHDANLASSSTQITEYTDAKGNVSTYRYNGTGKMIEMREAVGMP
jgi:YD repeat-containing protein